MTAIEFRHAATVRKTDWQFILCHTPDPTDPTGPLDEIGELESARSRSVEITRNRAGSASCQISIYDEFIKELLDKVPMGDVRGTLRKTLLVRRNKVDMWSGPIVSIQGSLADGASSLTISAVGWIEYLFHRELAADKHYTSQRADVIAFDLLSVANLQTPLYPVPIFPGTAYGASLPTSIRSPTFSKGDTFGASIQKLSDVESGFDFDVNPRTRELNIFAWDSYVVRNNIRLGYRWGPQNIAKLDWTEAGINTRNHITAVGNSNMPYSDSDVPAIEEYGLFQETVTLPVETAEILPAYVNAELAVRSRPQITYTVTPKSLGQIEDDSPHLFEDYFIGDQISFTAKEGYFEVKNQGIRIFGANVSISDEGVETIDTLQTTPTT